MRLSCYLRFSATFCLLATCLFLFILVNGPSLRVYMPTMESVDGLAELLRCEKMRDNRDGHFGSRVLTTVNKDRSEGQSAAILKHLSGKARMLVSRGKEDWMKGSSAIDGYHTVALENQTYIEVQCYPLMSILRAAGLTNLDVLCLDVQGAELDILKSLSWDQVNITLLVLEDDHVDMNKRIQKHNDTTSYLQSFGYKFVDRVAQDYFYLKKN
ncbi:unnamed protein product [Notodromas monacha]|uniref:Methyltransferase FkbM domain-containing protein n=1 Tax=Notodromas monacha TaxID=399045 RepID=A0A7R9GE51_9CRUS|nr:unnamed protein product [Notodromas monacha]CAG0917900.1 unnamed protein product [Notodromas monacha]